MCSCVGFAEYQTNPELKLMTDLTSKICSKQTLDEISYDMKMSKEEILDTISKIKDFNPKAFKDLTCILGPLDEVEMVWKKIDKLKIELRKKESMDTVSASELSKEIENLYEELKAIIMK